MLYQLPKAQPVQAVIVARLAPAHFVRKFNGLLAKASDFSSRLIEITDEGGEARRGLNAESEKTKPSMVFTSGTFDQSLCGPVFFEKLMLN